MTIAPETPTGGMHRELSVVDAAAFSVGLIGPVGEWDTTLAAWAYDELRPQL